MDKSLGQVPWVEQKMVIIKYLQKQKNIVIIHTNAREEHLQRKGRFDQFTGLPIIQGNANATSAQTSSQSLENLRLKEVTYIPKGLPNTLNYILSSGNACYWNVMAQTMLAPQASRLAVRYIELCCLNYAV